jgi:hypothetical protein
MDYYEQQARFAEAADAKAYAEARLCAQKHMFQESVNKAIASVRQVLDNTKHPQLCENVSHQYEDKYLLSEFLTNTALSSMFTCLSKLGVTTEQLAQLAEWTKTRSVSLSFQSETKCSFNRETQREEDSKTKTVTEVSSLIGSASFESKVVTTINEFFWDFELSNQLVAYVGTGADDADRLVLQQRQSRHEVMTTTHSAPFPEVSVAKPVDVDVSVLVKSINPASCELLFSIDRKDKDTRTPRRNADIERIMTQLDDIWQWAKKVMRASWEQAQVSVVDKPSVDLGAISSNGVLIPVMPLFDDSVVATPAIEGAAAEVAEVQLVAKLSNSEQLEKSPLMLISDINSMLGEERKSLDRKCEEVASVFAVDGSVVTSADAIVGVVLRHMTDVIDTYNQSVQYVEDMLRDQLIAAIGKEVTPDQFAEYMSYHNNKLFKPAFAPKPMSYAIRRTAAHSPQGLITIESKPDKGDAIAQPISTLVHSSQATGYMTVKLSASTQLKFGGDRFVHGFLLHKFSGQPNPTLNFSARARQFSSFVVLLGQISGADSFDPTYGMIVRNKDEFTLPLDLETIPTAKEFKDAIQSLSPEQQDFCKAFRGMQLESTLFGVVVIQIVPQLEKLLNLAPDALAKEVLLTEQLMELFIKYQIPADLLAFEQGEHEVSERDPSRLEAVRAHVAALHQMLTSEKDKEAAEKRQEEEFRLVQIAAAEDARRQSTLSQLRAQLEEAHMAQNQMPEACLESSIQNWAQNQMQESAGLQRCSASFAERRGGRNNGGYSNSRQRGQSRGMAKNSMPQDMQRMQECSAGIPESSAARSSSSRKAAKSADGPTASQNTTQPNQAASTGAAMGSGVDYTKIPKQLDAKFEELDVDSALRPTIIKPGTLWTHKSQKTLLSTASTSKMSTSQQKSAKDEAFDLLDGLTRAGALSCDNASLHVVVAGTHCFDKDLVNTVVQDNVNPIAKVERSTLIMASTIMQASVEQLVAAENYDQIESSLVEALAIDRA